MKILKPLMLTVIFLLLIQACTEESQAPPKTPFIPTYNSTDILSLPATTKIPVEYSSTKGYQEDGQLITEFDCPDDKSFPPVNIKAWDKIPVVNGRLPLYEETKNGTSIHYYGEAETAAVKPYDMVLPKLAYYYSPSTTKMELVIVIQIVQNAKDIIVGFRYLTGGCGGSSFNKFRFLSAGEIKNVVKDL